LMNRRALAPQHRCWRPELKLPPGGIARGRRRASKSPSCARRKASRRVRCQSRATGGPAFAAGFAPLSLIISLTKNGSSASCVTKAYSGGALAQCHRRDFRRIDSAVLPISRCRTGPENVIGYGCRIGIESGILSGHASRDRVLGIEGRTVYTQLRGVGPASPRRLYTPQRLVQCEWADPDDGRSLISSCVVRFRSAPSQSGACSVYFAWPCGLRRRQPVATCSRHKCAELAAGLGVSRGDHPRSRRARICGGTGLTRSNFVSVYARADPLLEMLRRG